MGDRQKRVLRVQFNVKRRLDFHRAKIRGDAGLLRFNELDEAFGPKELASAIFCDSRRGKNTHHTLLAMLQQAIHGQMAGYEDGNDAELLRVDPAMRRVVGDREHCASSVYE